MPLKLFHTGYQTDTYREKQKNNRNLTIFDKHRKHNQVDPALLEQVFMDLVHRIRQSTAPSSLRRDFRIIDSSTIGLCLQKFRWTKFRNAQQVSSHSEPIH
jgi:hypothetical protein